MAEIVPFKIAIPEAAITELRERLEMTRWPVGPPTTGVAASPCSSSRASPTSGSESTGANGRPR